MLTTLIGNMAKRNFKSFVLSTFALSNLLCIGNVYSAEDSCQKILPLEEIEAKDYTEQVRAFNDYMEQAFLSAPVKDKYNPLDVTVFKRGVLVKAATCLMDGTGVAKDREKAKQYLMAAEKLGDSGAAHMLASLHLFFGKDEAETKLGFATLEAEVKSGSSFSAGKVGHAYLFGLGVEQSFAKAVEFYEIAAKGGNTYWQIILSHAYAMGYLGLAKNKDLAEYWKKFEPKMHRYSYDCVVEQLYQDGTFPEEKWQEVQSQFSCSE